MPCKWSFEAPEGFGFKVVVQKLDSSVVLRIKNSTDIITNERSLELNFPYYNSDKFIQIDLPKPAPLISTGSDFEAYITIVKNIQEKNDANCSTFMNGTVLVWTNMDQNYEGYENNVRCNFNLTISPKTVVLARADLPITFTTEFGVDYVKYNDDGNDVIFPRQKHYARDVYIFESNKNGTDKTVMWEFVSDGK
uniref:CUB domain-containing protein n=1 Tax=Panagrolaimus davidi TaxID=227884 RepID=A0A914PUF1_9BILA